MDKVFTHKEQIDSHSSALTNLRIADIEARAWKLQLAAFSNLKLIEPAIDYWSCIQAYYTQALFFFESKATKKYKPMMEQRLKNGIKLSIGLQMGRGVAKPWILAQEAWEFHTLIRMAGQVLGYWTRMSKVEPKGLDEHIAMFKRIAPMEEL